MAHAAGVFDRTDDPARAPATRAPAGRLRGPYPAFVRPLDAVFERWARLRPRVRLLVVVLGVVALALSMQARVTRAEQRWGGGARTVLVATGDVPVGATEPAVEAVQLPPAAVPPGALAELPDGAAVALALPEGSVLTQAHVDPRGPVAGLAPGLRAVPVPVEEGWGVTAGAWVDVWVLGAAESPAVRVARSRSVLEVRDDGATASALVGLADDEVAATTEGLALGRVLLTHAPPP